MSNTENSKLFKDVFVLHE